jgi:hypothetical protein
LKKLKSNLVVSNLVVRSCLEEAAEAEDDDLTHPS